MRSLQTFIKWPWSKQKKEESNLVNVLSDIDRQKPIEKIVEATKKSEHPQGEVFQIDLASKTVGAQRQTVLSEIGSALESESSAVKIQLAGTDGVAEIVVEKEPTPQGRGQGKGSGQGHRQGQGSGQGSGQGQKNELVGRGSGQGQGVGNALAGRGPGSGQALGRGLGRGRKKGSLRDGFRYVRIYWKPYVGTASLIIGCQMAYKVFQTFFALSLKVIVDSALAATAASAVIPLLTGLLLGFPIAVALALVGERLTARTSSRLMNDIRTDIYKHLQRLPIEFYTKTQLGDIIARFSTDLFVIERGVALRFVPGVVATGSVLLNLPILLWINVPLALGTIATLPMVYWVVEQLTPRAAESNYQFKRSEAQLINTVQENVRAQQLIRSFRMVPQMTNRFEDELSSIEDTNTEANFDRALVENGANMSLMLVQLFATIAGAALTLGGAMSVGSLIAFTSVLAVVNQDLYDLFRRTLPQLVAATGGIRRVEELLNEKATIVDATYAVVLPPFQNNIRFNNVTFSYDGKRNHLSEIDLDIQAGQTVAFVGPSGSGKSTIVNLLLRFYDVNRGKITVDGVDIRDVQQESLRSQMGIVLQDTFLFNATIEENIRIVKPDATQAEVMAAATVAELHDFIMTLPQGYQTTVGESGGQISGGQRQRIAIARAMLCNPRILVLDEATSSLDAEIAASIQATLERIAQNRTVISITHHLPFAVNADKIFVLNEGRIVECGPHETLLAEQGLYTHLWETQVHQHRMLTVDD
ncbi:MAG: ABC transporter ATP-binding protein [Chloroflexota bacterium]